MGIFFTIIILVSFTGQALGTSCSVSNRRTNLSQCLRDINGEGNNNTAYWFGTQYPTNCPQGSTGQTLECSNPLAGSNRTSLFSRIFPGGLNTNSLDRFLKMEFTSPPGTYTACGNTYKTNTTWSRDIDPLSPLTVRPWDVRFLPYLEWATLPGEMFTLVVYDPGYLVTHAIYNNIRGHDISTADGTIVYQGPGIMDDKILNPYVFMLFKQSGHVTVSSALKSQLHQNISFSELINQWQLTGPIGMNWLKVVGDIYAAQQHLNLINQCPKYVEEELNKLKKRPFLPSPVHNNVGIAVRFNTAAIDFTVCCTKHSYSQESFELNPIGNPVYNSYKVSHTPSVAFLKAEFSSQASNFTGDMYTLMMIDPDVAASSIATEDRPLVHWLVANIRNGNVSSGDEYARYIGPRPPDRKPHYYYFLLYKQTAAIPVSSLYAYSEHCSYAPGRCLFNITRLETEKKLTLVGVTWMRSTTDIYVAFQHIYIDGENAAHWCAGMQGYKGDPSCSTGSSTVLHPTEIIG